jgi:hypothetical protein
MSSIAKHVFNKQGTSCENSQLDINFPRIIVARTKRICESDRSKFSMAKWFLAAKRIFPREKVLQPDWLVKVDFHWTQNHQFS